MFHLCFSFTSKLVEVKFTAYRTCDCEILMDFLHFPYAQVWKRKQMAKQRAIISTDGALKLKIGLKTGYYIFCYMTMF